MTSTSRVFGNHIKFTSFNQINMSTFSRMLLTRAGRTALTKTAQRGTSRGGESTCSLYRVGIEGRHGFTGCPTGVRTPRRLSRCCWCSCVHADSLLVLWFVVLPWFVSGVSSSPALRGLHYAAANGSDADLQAVLKEKKPDLLIVVSTGARHVGISAGACHFGCIRMWQR